MSVRPASAISAPRPEAAPTLCLSWRAEWARRRLLQQLGSIRDGEVRIVDSLGNHVFGHFSDDCPLQATVTVNDPRLYERLLFGGSIAAGETFEAGDWSCDDIAALCRIVLRNAHAFDALDGPLSRIADWCHRVGHWVRRNSPDNSRENIAAHYDLGNDFFEEILDPTLMYSCALFPTESSSLESASIAKLDYVCRKLELGPGDRLLEIGTGWGGMACFAAKHYGCRVTTTTISRRQFEFARERVRKAGLGDRVTVLLEDYRDLAGVYDKIVSIEMIEAVGEAYLDTYLKQCARLLRPQGMMLLQTITMADEHFARYRKAVDFIQRYIFPGGFLPSVGTLAERIGRATDLRLFHLDDLGPHYAVTLQHWRRRLLERADTLRRLGYPDALIRRFDYYFAYCESGFHERRTGLVQMLLTKPLCRRDPILAPLGRNMEMTCQQLFAGEH